MDEADSNQLPEFSNPPVVEVALGVQFRPVYGLRPIELAILREKWRSKYPVIQELPPLPPAIEDSGMGQSVQFFVGPALQSRLWFLTEEQEWLIQLQHDRLTVNWRQTDSSQSYPRYSAVKREFRERWRDLSEFLEDKGLGSLSVSQVEVNYINAVDPEEVGLGSLEKAVRYWNPLPDFHLGQPEQARFALVHPVDNVGRPPVRLYVSGEPGQRPNRQETLFLTLTLRGAPAEDTLDSALLFMDAAHSHIVRSFAEMTPEAMQIKWGRTV